MDYLVFGSTMPGRSWDAGLGYRFAFNGKEKDNLGEGGGGSTYNYGFRIYNPLIGRFLSIDPLFRKYPELTPYQFASNTPIASVDLDGKESAIVTGTQQANGTQTSTTIFLPKAGNMGDGVLTVMNNANGTTSFSYQQAIIVKADKDRGFWGNIVHNISNWWNKGDGSQKGGLWGTSETGGASPTKTVSLTDAEKTDFGDLLTALGALNQSPTTEEKGLPDALRKLTGVIKTVLEKGSKPENDLDKTTQPEGDKDTTIIEWETYYSKGSKNSSGIPKTMKKSEYDKQKKK